jgi:hypothetical protein
MFWKIRITTPSIETTKYSKAGGQRSFILLGKAILYYKIMIEKNIIIIIEIIFLDFYSFT